jgi:hypothetical protein
MPYGGRRFRLAHCLDRSAFWFTSGLRNDEVTERAAGRVGLERHDTTRLRSLLTAFLHCCEAWPEGMNECQRKSKSDQLAELGFTPWSVFNFRRQ